MSSKLLYRIKEENLISIEEFTLTFSFTIKRLKSITKEQNEWTSVSFHN
jgi:hypothetical protein